MLETQQLRHRLSCPKGASILSEETDNEQTSEMANMTSGNEKCYKIFSDDKELQGCCFN